MRQAANDNLKPERIYAAQVSAIIGAPLRTVQTMAARGDLPSAAKIGRRWSFNEDAVRSWLKREEIKCQNEKHRPIPTGVTTFSGAVYASRAALPCNGHLAQTIQKLRRGVSRTTKPNSRAA